MSDHIEPPVNPLPGIVVALALPIVAIELWLGAGARGFVGGPEAIGWRLDAIREYGFFSELLGFMYLTGQWSIEHVARFLTYPFVHFNFTHALMVLVFLLALGKMVGEIFSTVAFLVVFFGSAFLGAVAYAVIAHDATPLVGGYPAVYGLIGAYTYLLWVQAARMGTSQYRAFTLIGFLLALQLIFGVLFGGNRQWIAEVAGFGSGFLLSFLVGPGGWQQIRQKLRAR